MNTTVTPDVNEAFRAERAGQFEAAAKASADFDARIAEGKLVPIGGDRFRVNDPGNWDNGEILVRQGGQILPQHGLDESKGSVALYSALPAWHSLGNVIPGGISDIDEVLRLGGIDFEVQRTPVLFRPEGFDGPTKLVKEQFVNFRTDTGDALGVVGAKYHIIQNRQNFEFLQDLTGLDDIVWESAGALRGGSRVFVSMRLPDTITIDAEGINDQIIPFIVAINSHDGSGQAQVVTTPWRPVCGNTERFAVRDAFTRWGTRHTTNAAARFQQARETLKLSIKYYDSFAREEEALAQTAITIDEFRKIANELWKPPADDAKQQAKTVHENRLEKLTGYYAKNAGQLGHTAYAAERAITEYLDWGKGIRPAKSLRDDIMAARAAQALEGGSDDVKATAHRRLLTLVRR